MSTKVKKVSVTITLTAANTRYKISQNLGSIKTSLLEIYVPTANTDPVYVGDSTVSSSWIPRSKSSYFAFTPDGMAGFSKGDYFDLGEWYVLGTTAGDTVIVEYYAVSP